MQLLFQHRINFINSNFNLHKERISSNNRARVLITVIIMQCVPHFHYVHKNFSSIQLLVNKKFFHQFSIKLIKTFFISPASIYATLFIKVGGKVLGEDLDSVILFKGILCTLILVEHGFLRQSKIKLHHIVRNCHIMTAARFKYKQKEMHSRNYK